MESLTEDKKKVVDYEIQVPYGLSYLDELTEKDLEGKLRIRTSKSDEENLPVPIKPKREKTFRERLMHSIEENLSEMH